MDINKTNLLVDQAVKIKNGTQLDLRDLNLLFADLVLDGLSEQQIKQSATRIAHAKFDYELSQMNRMRSDLTKSLSRLNKPVSPLDL